MTPCLASLLLLRAAPVFYDPAGSSRAVVIVASILEKICGIVNVVPGQLEEPSAYAVDALLAMAAISAQAEMGFLAIEG